MRRPPSPAPVAKSSRLTVYTLKLSEILTTHRFCGLGRAALILGASLTLLVALIAHFGFRAIAQALQRTGWVGFSAMVILHFGLIVMMGLAWWLLGRGRPDAHPACFVWGRLTRDAAGETLPLSQVGGYFVGARAASLCGVSGTFATASTVVDLTIELIAKVPYTLLGLALLFWLKPHNRLFTPALLATLLMATLGGAFVAMQERGTGLIDKIGTRLASRRAPDPNGCSGSLRDAMREIRARRAGLWLSFLIHFASWLLGGVELWLPMWLMGIASGVSAAIAIDSLVGCIRCIAFVVPNALGVQEAAYVIVCGIFGVAPDVACALSLLRRGRDFAIAIPSLIAWQMMEGRSAWRIVAR